MSIRLLTSTSNSDVETTKIHDATEKATPDIQDPAQKPLNAPTEVDLHHLNLLSTLLKKAKIKKEDVSDIFISGNPKHVALLEPNISAYFADKKVFSRPDIRSDEAIIRGVSLHAKILAGYYDEDDTCCPIDITSVSLGIETAYGVFTKMVPRFSVIPTFRRQLVSTIRDGQEKVVLKIYEGDRAIASKNKLLGVLELTDLPLTSRGELDIEVVFRVGLDWEVIVEARELKSGREAKIIVPGTEMTRYTQEELDLLDEEKEKRKEEDLRWLENARTEMAHGEEAMRFDVQLKG